MANRPIRHMKRNMVYWFPIILPILMAIVVTIPHVGLEYHFAREEEMKSTPQEKNTEAVGMRIPDHHDKKSKKHQDIAILTNENETENQKKILDRKERGQNGDLVSRSRKELIPSSVAEDSAHEKTVENGERISWIVAIWPYANEVIIVGVFAAYLHFFLVFLPSSTYLRRSIETDAAYMWVIVGAITHFPIVASIPYFHKMYGEYERVDDLMIASVLALGSLLIVIPIREIIWRKCDRTRFNGAMVVSDSR